MLVPWDRGLGIQRIAGAREKKVRDQVRSALRAVLFNHIADYLSLLGCPSGFIVISQPAPEKIPGHLLSRFRVAAIDFRKRLAGHVVEQFTMGPEFYFAGIFLCRFNVLF